MPATIIMNTDQMTQSKPAHDADYDADQGGNHEQQFEDAQPCPEQYAAEDRPEDDGGAQVGLRQYEKHRQRHDHAAGRHNRGPVDVGPHLGKILGQRHDDGDLRQFGRLNADETEPDPPAGALDRFGGQHGAQQDHHQDEYGYGNGLKEPYGQYRGNVHHPDAGHEPHGLQQVTGHAQAGLVPRGAVDHDDADHGQQDGNDDECAV